MFFNAHLKPILPGLVVTLLVALAAKLAEHAERMLFGRGWVESLVFAILIGVVVRSLFGLAPRYFAGVRFCAKTVLEIAIVLLGASISAQAIGSAGGGLVAAWWHNDRNCEYLLHVVRVRWPHRISRP